MSGGDPWSTIAQIIVGAGSRNMKQTKEGADTSQKYGQQNQQQGMTYQAAPQTQGPQTSPTENLTTIAGIPSSIQNQAPVWKDAIAGERGMLRPTISAQGGYVQGPTQVNSAQPGYDSALPDYIRRQGGFTL